MFDDSDQPDRRSTATFRITPDGDRFRVPELEDAFVRLHSMGPSLELDVRLTTDGSKLAYTVSATEQADTVERVFRDVCSTGTQIESLTTPPSPQLLDETKEPDAALQVRGRPVRRKDWQTRLRPTVEVDDVGVRGLPMADVADAIADSDAEVVYQAVVSPKPDWWASADIRKDRLRNDRDTLAQRVFGALLSGPPKHPDADTDSSDYRRSGPSSSSSRQTTAPGSPNDRRIDAIDATDPHHSFYVNVRAVASGPDAASVLRAIGTALVPAKGTFYELAPVVYDDADAIETITTRLQNGTCRRKASLGKRLLHRVPLAGNDSPAIVADPLTAPNVCLLDGEALGTAGQQALDVTAEEDTGIALPSDDTLARYQRGLTLGHPLTADDEPLDATVALPPSLQPLHVAWFGKTGSGKSTSLATAMLDNHAATDGADILIDRKGDGLPTDYLRAHYERYGDLEDVLYYDCQDLLPALSFFDIRDQLEAGVPRETAVEAVADHYIELLRAVMPGEGFDRAVRSPDLIRYLVKALFDPEHGADTYTHRDLEAAVQRMRATGEPPAVSDPDLERLLDGVAQTRTSSLDQLLDGVLTRIEKFPADHRLNRLFNHAPQRDAADQSPLLDLQAVLDDDTAIVIDTSALRTPSQRTFTLVVLSQLWTALQHRTHHETPTRGSTGRESESSPDGGPTTTAGGQDRLAHAGREEPPLVNLYLEEAADVAHSGLIKDLLSQSRAFQLSVTLAMQFPDQLRQRDPDTYRELLNNVSTIVTGNVPADDSLTDRLATSDMPPDQVADRLRSLRRGQWLTTLPAAFGHAEPKPFLLESATPPKGHPAHDTDLDPTREQAFDAARTLCIDHTRQTAGLDITGTGPGDDHTEPGPDSHTDDPSDTDPDTDTDTDADEDTTPDADTDTDALAESDPDRRPRVDTTLPYTQRLPRHLEYDQERHVLVCTECDARYAPAPSGLQRALECHPSGDVDRDDVPICGVDLKLTPEERARTGYTDAQLMFLQAVYNASQGRYTAPHYDLTRDSMVRLREYVDINPDAIQELQDDGLLRHDTDYPHRLYTVTPDGRTVLGESHRRGVAHGHQQGDLAESSHHRMLVELGRRYLDHEYRRDPDSPVQTVTTYYDLPDDTLAHHVADAHDRDAGGNHRRLDAAALDPDGNIVVALEAERINNDYRNAIPTDYQKLAACQPTDAIWLVPRKPDGHTIATTLHDHGHIEKTYADTTPPADFTIDQPGLTTIHTIGTITTHLTHHTPTD